MSDELKGENMTEREIGRIRKKFILISTLSFFGVMFLMGGFIYLFSTFTVRNEVRQIMQYIVENDGDLPAILDDDGPETKKKHEKADGNENAGSEENAAGNENTGSEENAAGDGEAESDEDDPTENERIEWSLKGIFGVGELWGESPDYIYTIRYFAILFDEGENVEEIKTAHIAYIDKEDAEHYGRIALRRTIRFGSFGRYYYNVAERDTGGKIVIYLDRTAQIATINRILFAVLSLLGFGTLLAFFLMRIFSTDVVRSEIENAEKQKQFITNASHELKTPLAVIRANTEMQEMLDGESEWTQSTMRQVDRMNVLIQNLVKISRSQETETGEMVELDIAPAVRESAEAFIPVAQGIGKKLAVECDENVFIRCDESSVRQLVSLLTDNAVKYCDEGGDVRVLLKKNGKNVILTVSNTFRNGKDIDTKRFFERFYREDKARTISGNSDSEKSGFGIGLSIAESIVKGMKGTIDAAWKDERITFTCRLKGRR